MGGEQNLPDTAGSTGTCELRLPSVSIIIPMRNEAAHIAECLNSILAQEYPFEKIEILVIDGKSTDGSREIVTQVARSHPSVYLLDNPRMITSEAVNIGIQASSGQIIVIVGGHSVISTTYVAKAVSYLSRPDLHIGGVGPTLKHIGEGLFGNLVAHALSSPFGVGNSRFRFSRKMQFVDTIAYGVYHKDVFKKVGLWNTDLVRNQDIEFNYRVRKAGWQLLLVPDMGCIYYTLTTLIGFVLQNYGNGYWNILTFAKGSVNLSWRHFVPLAFISGLFGSMVIASFAYFGKILFIAILGSYLSLALVFSGKIAIKNGLRYLPIMPLIFLTLHFSYGLGSLWGIIKVWAKR